MSSYIEQLKLEEKAIDAAESKILALKEDCFELTESPEYGALEELQDSYTYLACQKALAFLQDQRMTTEIQIYAYNKGLKKEETNQ